MFTRYLLAANEERIHGFVQTSGTNSCFSLTDYLYILHTYDGVNEYTGKF